MDTVQSVLTFATCTISLHMGSVLCKYPSFNKLGAGKPRAAREAICAVLVLALTDAIILNNDMEIVHSVVKIILMLCLSINVDAFLRVLCGKFFTKRYICLIYHDYAINIHF
ncbi:Protein DETOXIFICATION 8, partial [Mucuna pruriens]